MSANARSVGDSQRPILIVKRPKKVVGGHHGGAWKVAYADFVTALMAFFLVMWLVATVSNEQRAALFDYFKNPSMEPGKSVKPAPGQNGPGGASTSAINLRGAMDAPKTAAPTPAGPGSPVIPSVAGATLSAETMAQQSTSANAQQVSQATEQQIAEAAERERLESLMDDLREAIDKSQALEPFKDQLLIDLSPEGLRVQIVDAKSRPMFDLGSAELQSYTRQILMELAHYLNSVPNHVSLSGHTDTRPYLGRKGYSNWELSTERANAARRALEEGGLGKDKTMRLVGLSSLVPFDKANPDNPINRRISIIVMTKKAEQQALQQLAAEPLPASPSPAEQSPVAMLYDEPHAEGPRDPGAESSITPSSIDASLRLSRSST